MALIAGLSELSRTSGGPSGFPIKCIEPARASPEHPACLHNVAPAGSAMSSASLLTIRRESFSNLIRGPQAGDDREVNPAHDGLTSLRGTSNNMELRWNMRSSWHKTVSFGNNWFIWSAQRTGTGYPPYPSQEPDRYLIITILLPWCNVKCYWCYL